MKLRNLIYPAIVCIGFGCAQTTTQETAGGDLVTEKISLKNLVPEEKQTPDSIMQALHSQHHSWNVLERRSVPGPFAKPEMKYFSEHAKKIEDLVVINPGPGEYVHVMEGQRDGYLNLTVGITETFPGGAPPMHTHKGEEAHVLLDGEILYALGDTIFTIKAPYIVNIPPMVPHAFKNIGDKTANLVVIFPTNVWEYDVLDYFPFDSTSVVSSNRFKKFKENLALREEALDPEL